MGRPGRLVGKASCALYHRVSTRDQNRALARRELRQAAAARGLRIVLDIEETGSGAHNNRPGLRRVMEAARKGEIAAVLVWKVDPFGRASLDLFSNKGALSGAGVRFVAVTQGLDVKPEGDAMSKRIPQGPSVGRTPGRSISKSPSRRAPTARRGRGVDTVGGGRPPLS